MTKIKVNTIMKNITQIEILIMEIKKLRPDFSDEEAFAIILELIKD